jgi:2-isopropylmalate synthase
MRQAERVAIFDTTLRDGEQAPGAAMKFEEKLGIARALERLGVDIIEAGFPASSSGDYQAVRAIARTVRSCTVAGLSRAVRPDIDRAWEVLKEAAQPRIHTFIATSQLHMQYKLQMTPTQVLEAVTDSVRYARNLCDDVEWSAEDGSRSDPDFLCRCAEAAVAQGATTINIADTVGYALPDEIIALIGQLRNRVPNIDRAVLSVHCHDDLGLAVANSLAAISAGARQVECTINGLGERAGNAALEEIVMALKTRRNGLPYETRIRTERIIETSRLVSKASGFLVPPNKPVVGANAFAHASGIHQHGVLQNPATYEVMLPDSIGHDSSLVMAKHSGRHGFRAKLEGLGFDLNESEFDDAFRQFKDVADQLKSVPDEDIIALVACVRARHMTIGT